MDDSGRLLALPCCEYWTAWRLFAEHWDWLKAWALGLNKGRFPGLQQAFDEAVKLQTYASSDSEGAANNPDVLRIMTVHSANPF